MSKQPEALRLAGALYDDGEVPSLDECSQAAAELRRLHASNAELLNELREVLEWAKKEKAPLRDTEIKSIERVIRNAEEQA
jgi:hypothetical protein